TVVRVIQRSSDRGGGSTSQRVNAVNGDQVNRASDRTSNSGRDLVNNPHLVVSVRPANLVRHAHRDLTLDRGSSHRRQHDSVGGLLRPPSHDLSARLTRKTNRSNVTEQGRPLRRELSNDRLVTNTVNNGAQRSGGQAKRRSLKSHNKWHPFLIVVKQPMCQRRPDRNSANCRISASPSFAGISPSPGT